MQRRVRLYVVKDGGSGSTGRKGDRERHSVCVFGFRDE
jgi:hypothetical protein